MLLINDSMKLPDMVLLYDHIFYEYIKRTYGNKFCSAYITEEVVLCLNKEIKIWVFLQKPSHWSSYVIVSLFQKIHNAIKAKSWCV